MKIRPQAELRVPYIIVHNSLYELPTQTVLHAGKTPNNPQGIEEYEVKGKMMISMKQLFTTNNEILIGFGKPNVFTVVPKQNVGYEKLDAFMFYRKKAQIARADQVQSGIFIRLKNVSPQILNSIRKSMKKIVGEKDISCARSNAKMLNTAGFTSGKKRLSQITPFLLFRKIVVHGLEYKGQKIYFDIINTTPNNLEKHFGGVMQNVFTSPFRAIKKSCCAGKEILTKTDISKIRKMLKTKIREPIAKFDTDLSHTATYRSSRPSKLGAFVRLLTKAPHILHEIIPTNKEVNIDEYLQDSLIDKYHRSEKVEGFINKAKSFAFSRCIVRFLLKHLAMEFDAEQEFTIKQLLDILPTSTKKGGQILQTIVICGTKSERGSRIIITPVKAGNKFADWILTKHLIASGYDNDVRFAGEAWGEKYLSKNNETKIRINITNNSGTYTPTEKQAQMAVRFLQKVVGNDSEVLLNTE